LASNLIFGKAFLGKDVKSAVHDLARPSISVLLCVHASNPWLPAAIYSVLNQTHRYFEFLIAANACSDDLWNELQGLVASDPRVQLFRTEIGQLSFNLNVLADRASGEYLIRMDSDDLSEPNRLEVICKELTREPVDILGSAVTLIDGSDEVVGSMEFPLSKSEILRAIWFRTVFCHPAVAIRRSFLLSQRGYLGGFSSEDTDLWLRAVRAGASMRNISVPLLRYRVHSGQSISSGGGYAEVAGHWLREFLLSPGWFHFKGLVVALYKTLFRRRLPHIKRYSKPIPKGTSAE
jgi:glycosyltransferase involved in cell wall biosynthesis